MQEKQVQSLGQENPLEEGMATQSNILAWTEEPGGLWSIASHRVGHHWSDLASIRIYYIVPQLHVRDCELNADKNCGFA